MLKGTNKEKSGLSFLQILLIIILYGGIMASIILSIIATKNIGQEGYDKCMEKKCEKRGQAFCSRFREINNCCLGSGGKTNLINNECVCVFD